MAKHLLLFAAFSFITLLSYAQDDPVESDEHAGEFGISSGVGHYFGDLNPDAAVNHPKYSGGIFFSKQFTNYIGIRANGNYIMLGYSDKYSKNPVQKRRNLSFDTDVWEFSVSGIFNFYQFNPGYSDLSFTPYVGLGVGVLHFDPYTYLNGTKYFLRLLGTEGQLDPSKKTGNAYSNVAYCIPITLGVKQNLYRRVNIFAELCYRFTTTDHLDDVSSTYNPDAFLSNQGTNSVAYLLQDRSYEYGQRIGIKGRQRGNTSQNDTYATFQVGISYNFQRFHCPEFR